MPNYPIKVSFESYRGSNPAKRMKVYERNKLAKRLEDVANEMIREGGPGTYLYYQIAERAGVDVETVSKIMFSVGCGSNGFTIFRGANGETLLGATDESPAG